MKKQNKFLLFVGKIADVIILPSCLFAIFAFAVVLYYSIVAMVPILSNTSLLQDKMLYIGILVAITYSVMGFIEMFIKTFGETFRHLLKTQKEVSNE